MTPGEREAFKAGVQLMISAADRSAKAIATTTRRPLVEGFGVEACEELAKAGRELLVREPAAAAGRAEDRR